MPKSLSMHVASLRGDGIMSDKRSRNRTREHEKHGWEDVTDVLAQRVKTPRLRTERFFQCPQPCGWSGWIKPVEKSTTVVR